MKLWITGYIRESIGEIQTDKNGIEWQLSAWDLIGVFDSEQKAINSCVNEHCFIGPVNLNENLGSITTGWEGCYYPLSDNPLEKLNKGL